MLSASLTLMLRQGVKATTYADVVRASGLHEETVRKYAEDIEGVTLKVLDDIEQDVIEAMISEVSKAPSTAEAKLGAFIETLTRAQHGRANRMALLVLMGTEYAGNEGRVATRTSRLFSHLYRTIEGIIQFGWLRSTFRTDLPVKELTAAFVGALTGTVLEARRMGTALDPIQLDRAVRLVLLRGMEDRIALERMLSGFVVPGYHP